MRRSANQVRATGERRAARTLGDSMPPLPPPAAKPPPTPEDPGRPARERASRLLAAASVPKLYAAADLADASGVPADVRDRYAAAAMQLAGLADKPGLVVLLGRRGPGKTHMACGLVRHFCRAGRSARYAEATDYFVAVKETFGPSPKLNQSQVEAQFLRPELLVVDEVDERGDTAWEDRMLTRLVNKRYAAGVATVLVSNQTKQAFVDRVGPSIADRILDGGGIIYCEWGSLRGRVARPEAGKGNA